MTIVDLKQFAHHRHHVTIHAEWGGGANEHARTHANLTAYMFTAYMLTCLHAYLLACLRNTDLAPLEHRFSPIYHRINTAITSL